MRISGSNTTVNGQGKAAAVSATAKGPRGPEGQSTWGKGRRNGAQGENRGRRAEREAERETECALVRHCYCWPWRGEIDLPLPPPLWRGECTASPSPATRFSGWRASYSLALAATASPVTTPGKNAKPFPVLPRLPLLALNCPIRRFPFSNSTPATQRHAFRHLIARAISVCCLSSDAFLRSCPRLRSLWPCRSTGHN